MLFLDIKAAFLSIIIKKLLYNLKKIGIPQEYIDWYECRLNGRSTILIFDDFNSNMFNVEGGVDQGCPLFLLALIFYNTDLLRIADLRLQKGKLSLRFIDVVALVARGKMYQDSHAKLVSMMEKRDGIV